MGRAAHPPETRARAVELRAAGFSYSQISAELGVASNTVQRWIKPDYAAYSRAKSRAYKESKHGICVECGGPTKLNKNGDGFNPSCQWCAQGKTPPPPPDRRRCVPIRLCDLRSDVLLAGAWEANRFEQGDLEKQEILLAAIFPSDRVHWISETARRLLDQAAA